MLHSLFSLLASGLSSKVAVAQTDHAASIATPIDVAEPVDVSEQAALHRAFHDLSQPLLVSRDAYEALVAWTPADSERHDTDIDSETRLDSLIAQASGAMERVRGGFHHALFLVEHYSKCKRGNPRRARVLLRATPTGLIIDLA